jgi:hypothetical protein
MIQIVECEQGTEEWYAARLGIPTASCFATVLASGRDGGASKTRAEYMRKLAGEILTGRPMDSYSNGHMERGKEWEAEARDLYAFMKDAEPQSVGFVRNGQKGCSPDSLINADGGLEIKGAAAHIQVERLLANRVPPAHRAQVLGSIWVTEREWWDFVSYCPGLPLLVVREHRDEEYIRTLAAAVDQFNDELAEMVESIRRLGGGSTLRGDLAASLEAA